jgi:signal transduction histidine kinase
VGKLGAGVAHELRNPLGVINNSTYYLKTRLKDADAKVDKHLSIIEREVDAANRIITDLMNFVRVTDLSMVPEDVNSLVERALERIPVPEDVRVNRQYGVDLPPVPMDSGKIEQVMLNLITNALQAMPDGGDLYLNTALQNGHVEIHVADSGAGIPADSQERIFEPLYTTKAKGIGLGLSLVKLLIEAHQGEIAVTSRVGEGARFVVRIPHQMGQHRPEPMHHG